MSPNSIAPAPLIHFDFRCDHTVQQPGKSHQGFIRRDEIALHLVEQGRLRVVFASGERVELGPHRLMASWGAMPHLAEWLQKDTTIDGLILPLAWFLRWQLPAAFTSALLAGRILIETDAAQGARDQAMLRQWVTLLAQPNDENRRIVLLEAEDRLRRLAQTCQPAGRPRPGAHSTKVDQVIQLIAKRFASRLTLPALAAQLGVHPNYLSTLFRRETGQTLSHYLTEYRLGHACALLVSTTDKIIDIASAAGFGSLSRFHTSFRRHRGCTPRQYRRTHHPQTAG